MSVVLQLLASKHPQMLEPDFVIRRDERLERPLRLCAKGRLLVIRQSQEGAERCDDIPPALGPDPVPHSSGSRP